MAYDVYTINGVVLDVWNHKEWDKKFTFYSKEYGIMNIVAIGLQRPKSKLRGYIIRFCNISIDVVHGKSGYRLVRARSSLSGFLMYKKESYFLLSRVSKLFQDILPSTVPDTRSFLLFVSLGKYLENNIILKSSANKIFYETALRLFSVLGYRKEYEFDFELTNYNQFNLKIDESKLLSEYEAILNENGLRSVIILP